MKLTLLTAAALAALVAGAAQAQSAADWAGPYLGAHVGYGSQPDDDDETIQFDRDLDGDFGDTVTTSGGANAFSPGFCGGRAEGPTPGDGCEDDENGATYGVRAGWDFAVSEGWVLGGVIEYDAADLTDSVSAFSTTPARYTMTRELDSLWAARIRGGYAFGDLLGYATVGVVRGEVDSSFSTSNGVNTFVESGEDDASGWQLGGGLEKRFGTGWSLGVEYLYTSLEDDSYRVRAQGPAPATNPFILGNPNGTDFRRSDDDFDFHAVRLTLAWRF